MDEFARTRPPARGELISLRVTPDEKEFVAAMAEALNVRGTVAVLRLALDYYVGHSPEGKAAAKTARASLGRK